MQKFGDILGGVSQLMHYATPPEEDWVASRLKILRARSGNLNRRG